MSSTTNGSTEPNKLAQLRSHILSSSASASPSSKSVDRILEVSDELFKRAPVDFLKETTITEMARIAVDSSRFFDTFLSHPEPYLLHMELFPDTSSRSGTAALYSAAIDRPFIVDTLSEFFRSHRLKAHVLLHPILVAPDGRRISLIYAEVSRIENSSAVTSLLEEANALFSDLVAVTEDFSAMLVRVQTTAKLIDSGVGLTNISEVDRREVSSFLQWLGDGGFVFLGYREWELHLKDDSRRLPSQSTVIEPSNLGLFRTTNPVRAKDLLDTERDAAYLLSRQDILHVSRVLMTSPIHRSARMDAIFVKVPSTRSNVVTIQCFLGLPTSKSISQEASSVPIIRQKLQQILELEGAQPNSHDYKEIVSVVDSTPKSQLLRHSVETLRSNIRLIIGIESQSDVRVSVHLDAVRRFYTVIVVLPREKFSQLIRQRIQRHLERKLGVQEGSSEYLLSVTEDPYIRISFTIPNPDYTEKKFSFEELESELSHLTLSWNDLLLQQLTERHGPNVAARLVRYYSEALPEDYRATTSVSEAVFDIGRLEALTTDNPLEVELKNPEEKTDSAFYDLKLYKRGGGFTLSAIVPILENLGFEIFSEKTTSITTNETLWAAIYTLRVRTHNKMEIDFEKIAGVTLPGLRRVLAGTAENDRLNALLLSPGLSWREVALLRTAQRYLWQIRVFGSGGGIVEALIQNPSVSQILINYFYVKFDLDLGTPSSRETELESLKTRFITELKAVKNLLHDRVLRAAFNVFESTVRTTYFQSADDHLIGIKIDCQKILQMPTPRPMYETFVSALDVEGVHLRGGKVARGGLRWSDRKEDFRTEVLGLMKTQTTKNAIIVPVGAKGGFIVKTTPSEERPLPLLVKEAYIRFVRTLLQLSDNVGADGERVPPEKVICYDTNDPYLVVAADKGTATFSDVANKLAIEEFDFWLNDAFASGGSQGYDHKKYGITARGAWEAMLRHFKEIGIDPNAQPITAIGLGDMSGDVFGNGLLCSETIKLIAAFNHKHIFLDPNPDPTISFIERKRLFELPGSQWSDYKSDLLSLGGGVFDRTQKEITISSEAQAALGMTHSVLSGDELIQAILKAPVDLLWNGGIGTYVKASFEDNIGVGDRTNDDVRVDANQLRAKVVAEGGNLGFTQQARIEFALNGGRINTDALDNSGGVDLSDHEVNLKILLREPGKRKELSFEDRNKLLLSIANEVCATVMARNRAQSLALSLEQRRGKTQLSFYVKLFAELEKSLGLNRKSEGLPDNENLLQHAKNKQGLTRPELAVVMAYVKMFVFETLTKAEHIDQDLLAPYLVSYFPNLIRKNYHADIVHHQLHKEIVATQIANVFVERMGITFLHRLMQETGAAPVDILSAFAVADSILHSSELVEKLDVLDKPQTTLVFLRALQGVSRALDGMIRWLLEHRQKGISWFQMVNRYSSALQTLLLKVETLMPNAERAKYQEFYKQLVMNGFPVEIARTVASLSYSSAYLDIVELAVQTSIDVTQMATIYATLATELQVGLLLEQLNGMETSDPWEELAQRSMNADLRRVVSRIVRRIVAGQSKANVESVQAFLGARASLLDRYRLLLVDFHNRPATVASLLVLSNQLQLLAHD